MRRVRNHLAQKMGSAAREGTATGLVGREHECAVIDALLDGAAGGESGALVLRAEAGMGKTSLLRPRRRSRGRAIARCSAGDRRRGGVRPRFRRPAQPGAADHRTAPAAARARSATALAAALGLAPERRRGSLPGVGGSAVAARGGRRGAPGPVPGRRRPVARRAVRGSLVFTARRLGAEGVVILFAAREGERRRFDGARARRAGARRAGLDLGGESCSTVGHRDAAPSVRDRLLAEAAGNPLALLELPAALSDAQLARSGRCPTRCR